MKVHRIALVIISGFFVAGCHPDFVGLNSYNAATTPNSYKPYTMDPGSYAGYGFSSGGRAPGMSYGTGSQEGAYDGHPYCGDPGHYVRMAAIKKDQFGNGPVNWSASDQVSSQNSEQ